MDEGEVPPGPHLEEGDDKRGLAGGLRIPPLLHLLLELALDVAANLGHRLQGVREGWGRENKEVTSTWGLCAPAVSTGNLR